MYESIVDMPDYLRKGLPPEAQQIVRGVINYLVYEQSMSAGDAASHAQGALKNAGYEWNGKKWSSAVTKAISRGVILKTVKEKKLAFGWASVIKIDDKIVLDREDDFIDDSWELEKTAYDFVINGGTAGEMHLNVGVGDLVESMVFTDEKVQKMGIPVGIIPEGWWVGFKVRKADVWKKILKGDYTGFSIHGTGVRKKMPVDDSTHTVAGR